MRKLAIGNKNYSSGSMRPWVLMTQAQIRFEEVPIWLSGPDTAANIARDLPHGKVPVLSTLEQLAAREGHAQARYDSLCP